MSSVSRDTPKRTKTQHQQRNNHGDGGGAQGGRGRGGGRRGGGRNSNRPSKSISHALSWALRHGAQDLKLRMTSDGYCPIQDLIHHSHPKLQNITSIDQLRPVVETSDKQRFRMELRPAYLYDTPSSKLSSGQWSIIAITPEQALPVTSRIDAATTVSAQREQNEGTLGSTTAKDMESSKQTSSNDTTEKQDITTTATQEKEATQQNQKVENADELIWCIRANQGHSLEGMNPDYLLQRIPPEELATMPVIVHGTYWDAWKQIQAAGGLSRMGRTHIHLAAGLPQKNPNNNNSSSDNNHQDTAAVISGMRTSSQIHIYLDGAKCAADAIPFYRSDNGVILTAGVRNEGILPLQYISHVTDRDGKILLDQRRVVVATEQETKP